MRIIEISQPGEPDVLVVSERPKPKPGRGEVLIDVQAAGVNRPDIFQRKGLYPPPEDASDIPGLEVAGYIEAVGAGVADYHVGDSVCALVHGGGYADYCVADQRSVLPVPQSLTFVQAAALPETFFTVWYNVFERGGLEAGDRFLVHGGSSGIGSTAIQLAKGFGAWVATTVGDDEKRLFCEELGADLVINYKTESFLDRIKDVTKGEGVNIVLDMTGGDFLPLNLDCLARDGRHISIAFLRGRDAPVNISTVMRERLILTGSTLRAQSAEEKGDIRESLALFVWPMLDTGSIKPHIFKTFPLEQASEAHRLMESGKHRGKIVLTTR